MGVHGVLIVFFAHPTCSDLFTSKFTVRKYVKTGFHIRGA